uniref:Uncharacterized protein n=1 Tax=Glossina palpalis gambiensis TaxID=67801 RepID=A0A1B0AQ92_9MUSC
MSLIFPYLFSFYLHYRRMGGDGSSRHSSDDYTEINKTQSVAAINCKTLINEIRQAVNEAQPKVPWQQQQPSHNNGPPSPTSMSSGCSSPGYSPSKGMDLSGSSCSFSERKGGYNFKGGPVHEWSKEQVNIYFTLKIIFKSKFLENPV